MYIHIVKNSVFHDSRVLRECEVLAEVGQVMILGLYDKNVSYSSNLLFRVKLVKLWSRPLPKMLFFQLFKYLEWVSKVFLIAIKHKPSVVHCHDLSPLLIGVLLKKISGCRLIYDAHELETETHHMGGVRQKMARLYETVLIKRVDSLITVSPSILKWYQQIYGLQHCYLLRNIPEQYQSQKCATLGVRQEFFIADECIVYIFVGALRKKKGIEPLLDIFSEFSQGKLAHLVIMGDGELKATVVSKAAESSNIHYKAAVDPSEVVSVVASADVGFIYTEDSCLSRRYSLPNKFFQYLHAGNPVVCANLPDMRELVDQYRLGWVVQNDDEVRELVGGLSRSDIQSRRESIKNFSDKVSWEKDVNVLKQIYSFD